MRLGSLHLAACVLGVCGMPIPAIAQDYPLRPIRLVVPVPAGGGPDGDARFVMARVAPLLGQPVIIENRPGAGGRIAIEAVVKSAPDGYTLLFGTPGMVLAPLLYPGFAVDLKRDLAPVGQLASTAYTLTVNAQVPAQTPLAYAALTRANPAYANVATYGVGTTTHLAAAWFGIATGADLKFIHYNTQAPFNDLLAGQTQAMVESLVAVIVHVKSGKLRVLGVTGRARNAVLPEVATFSEAGVTGFDPQVWNGVLAPAGTPRAVIQRVNAALAQAVRAPEVLAYRRTIASESVGGTAEEFAAFLDSERLKWGAVIDKIALKLE
jgi:tripartite-type tricarboxylate transporter receptor subunit TctC